MAFHVKHNKESDGCIIDSRLFCRNELTIEISSMKLMTRSFVQRIKRKDTRGTKERWKSHWMKRKCVDNQQIFHCPNEKTSAFCVQMRSTGTQYQVDCHSSFFRGKYKSWMTQRHKRRVTSSHQKATIQLWKWRQKWWWNAIKCSNRKKRECPIKKKLNKMERIDWVGEELKQKQHRNDREEPVKNSMWINVIVIRETKCFWCVYLPSFEEKKVKTTIAASHLVRLNTILDYMCVCVCDTDNTKRTSRQRKGKAKKLAPKSCSNETKCHCIFPHSPTTTHTHTQTRVRRNEMAKSSFIFILSLLTTEFFSLCHLMFHFSSASLS